MYHQQQDPGVQLTITIILISRARMAFSRLGWNDTIGAPSKDRFLLAMPFLRICTREFSADLCGQ